MHELTSRERIGRMFQHREADRIPFLDSPWAATLERWRREGLPEAVSWVDYFGLDHHAGIGVDTSPRYPVQTLEDTEEYRIYTSQWGATLKDFKHSATVPDFLDFTVKSPDAWHHAKARMQPDRDRINWEHLRQNYRTWREQGYWITANFWFGFDVAHSWMIGTERFLVALLETPDWCRDVFGTMLDLNLELFEMIWQKGYRFDAIRWPDDMGYKGHTFFSPAMYRELLKPYHRRAVEWAHDKGIKACLHSCGDIRTLLPDLVDIGIDMLNPLEVKAGVDPVAVKREYGDRLVLHGGINAVLWDQPAEICAEMRRVVPILKQNGGYVFGSDHSIPSSVSLEEFGRIVDEFKQLGSY